MNEPMRIESMNSAQLKALVSEAGLPKTNLKHELHNLAREAAQRLAVIKQLREAQALLQSLPPRHGVVSYGNTNIGVYDNVVTIWIKDGGSAANAGAAPARKKAKRSNADDPFAEAVVEKITCPITSALCVIPVVAEDGHVYERDAIARWLSTKAKSPLSNQNMGTRLLKCGSTRALVLAAIENGACDAAAAAAWHLESAKAVAAGKLPGTMSSAKDHLERADELAPSTEIQLMLRAAKLKLHEDLLAKEAAIAGIDGVATIFENKCRPCSRTLPSR